MDNMINGFEELNLTLEMEDLIEQEPSGLDLALDARLA